MSNKELIARARLGAAEYPINPFFREVAEALERADAAVAVQRRRAELAEASEDRMKEELEALRAQIAAAQKQEPICWLFNGEDGMWANFECGGYAYSVNLSNDPMSRKLAVAIANIHCGGKSGTGKVAAPIPAVPEGWQPIETAPKDNKKPLLLARFNDDGTMQSFDWDASWESDRESWEIPQEHYFWASHNGYVEDPTHWIFQPEWFAAAAPKPDTKGGAA